MRIEGKGGQGAVQVTEIISPAQYSNWAAPIVPVVKSNGAVGIGGDYKKSVNPVPEVDRSPLPDIEDLLVKLAGGVIFPKLALSQAYQLLLDEKSKGYTRVTTHKELSDTTAFLSGYLQHLVYSNYRGIVTEHPSDGSVYR